jgi:hypothetical protein
MPKQNEKLTSVGIPPHLHKAFKIDCIENKFTLQKLVERSMFLFLTNKDIKKLLLNTVNTNLTGSL